MGRTDDLTFPDPSERVPTLLVVEDEVLIRMSLSDFLQECGFRVLEASCAADAVALLQQDVVTIDLVFSDVRMPGAMDGFGLSRWIKENRPDVPVILASADRTKADVARELCAHEPFFAKPYDLQAVVAHVRQLLSEGKTATG